LHAVPLLLNSKFPLQQARWPSPPQAAAKDGVGENSKNAKSRAGKSKRQAQWFLSPPPETAGAQ
jgi:hypothetical protein